MRAFHRMVLVIIGLFLFLIHGTLFVFGQTFSSGSTGADGPLVVTRNTTLPLPPSGMFHFTTVDIQAGAVLTFTPNAANTPVRMLATGDVTISGAISVAGSNGMTGATTGLVVNPGGAGGPGGFRGGQGGPRGFNNLPPSVGEGPGGGGLPDFPPPQFGGGGKGGVYGPTLPSSFQSLIPLFGGSGGGGQRGSSTSSGSSGGGRGGALLLASSTKITQTGTLNAQGGRGGSQSNFTVLTAGSGSGGAIRLVAQEIISTGILNVQSPASFAGGPGIIRLEANPHTLSVSGTVVPGNARLVITFSPGPVISTSNPAFINVPTLRIDSVGGVPRPAATNGTFGVADIVLPDGTTNPVPVTLLATNTPVPTTFTVKLVRQFHDAIEYSAVSSSASDTFANSSVTVAVTFPPGFVSILNAFAEFQLSPLVSSLLPQLDGDPADRILVAAALGHPSMITVLTKSGNEVPVDALSVKDQRLLAQALGALQDGREGR